MNELYQEIISLQKQAIEQLDLIIDVLEKPREPLEPVLVKALSVLTDNLSATSKKLGLMK